MKTKLFHRLYLVFFAASLPMPLLYLAIFFLWRHNRIETPVAGLLLLAATLVPIVLGVWLIRRTVRTGWIATASSQSVPFADGIAGLSQADLFATDADYIRQTQEDLRRLEEQLVQSQKMEAIGTLAGGIAHDFNNVLAAIMGYVELAIFDADPRSKVHFELEQILKATNRAKDLVQQILSYSRKTERESRPMDLKPLIKETLKLVRATLPATIDIKQQMVCDGCLVQANATQMHQVIMNLCTNASQAMAETGGTLRIDLKKTDVMGGRATRQGISPGRYLELIVSDTGPGIAPEYKECIFDPYFTTKAEGEGTGLGLAVVRSIVQKHGGTIDVACKPGRGASFRILLPVTTAIPETVENKTRQLPRGTESILFVDDEPVLTEVGEKMLRRLGYCVTASNRPEEALNMVRKDPYRFNLVVTDATMPVMTGETLARKIFAVRPDMPVVLCTGFSKKLSPEKARRIGIEAFFLKPLSINQMAYTIRQILDLRTYSGSGHNTYLKAIPES